MGQCCAVGILGVRVVSGGGEMATPIATVFEYNTDNN